MEMPFSQESDLVRQLRRDLLVFNHSSLGRVVQLVAGGQQDALSTAKSAHKPPAETLSNKKRHKAHHTRTVLVSLILSNISVFNLSLAATLRRSSSATSC